MSVKDQEIMTKSSSSSTPTLDQKLTVEYRLCHMVKRSDFDGYGFNLHSEKGKPGQYIGKVDDKSPAETSGLRQGDRIIEVNGVNIGHETHKQVVQRIKAIENEVRLLVIDPEIETRIRQEHEKDEVDKTTTTTPASASAAAVAADCADEPVANNNNNSSSSNNNSRNSISTVSSADLSSNGGGQETQTTATLTATPSPSPPPPLKSSNDSAANNNGTSNGTSKSTTMASSSSTSTAAGLNLKMTAAEMRAKLQARKKYDPKNDSVDLRKKFDIIQKL